MSPPISSPSAVIVIGTQPISSPFAITTIDSSLTTPISEPLLGNPILPSSPAAHIITTTPITNLMDNDQVNINDSLYLHNLINPHQLPTTYNMNSLFHNRMSKIDYVYWKSHFQGVLHLHDLIYLLDEPN